MSNTENPELDQAKTGGGIGDIGRQPLDPSSENAGNADPVIERDGDEDGDKDGDGAETSDGGLAVDGEPAPSGEDPDDDADETLGTIV